MTDTLALPTDEDRALLRESVRGFLGTHWPAATAVERTAQPAAVAAITKQLAGQGLARLGTDRSEGGLQEILVVQQELGRAACPAPLLATLQANLLLTPLRTGHPAVVRLLDGLQAGDALAGFAFGALDGDRTGCALALAEGRVTGEVRYVDAGASLTWVLAAAAPGQIALVPVESPGVRIVPTRALGGEGLATIRFERAETAATLQVAPEALQDAIRIGRLAQAARAHGAAERAFELVVGYAKERRQFGRLIGSFQAIQHKLANAHMALLGVRLALATAAAQYDQGGGDWRVLASAACAFANAELRRVALETHHTFGAIGYAEEHEAPRHFKRVHQDVLRHGGSRRAREEMAVWFLDEGRDFPEYDLGPKANAFRAEVRAWLGQHWSREQQAAMRARPHGHREYDPEFARELGKTGWLGCNWPAKFGGQDRTPVEYLAFIEEMERQEAPRAGAPIQAVSWMLFGNEEQQRRYLPEILRGEAVYGMWYSEPDSGSDLASIRTRAVRDGDEWVINGQKIWTTSYWGQYMWLAAKTDPEARPAHAGITMFCVPTEVAGKSIRPVKTMYDGEFINTFLDDVRVPAESVVGGVNNGWKVLTESLGTERGVVGAMILAKLARSFVLACEVLRTTEADGRPLAADPVVRDTMGWYAAQIEIGRQIALHCALEAGQGETPPDLAAMMKVYAGELMERFFESMQDLLGMEAALSKDQEGAILRGRFDQQLRHSLMWVISLGTNEIQRNLVALRGLGLPR
jgi:alkylation response protein AidB-like acyl-CoA dehydrogenase